MGVVGRPGPETENRWGAEKVKKAKDPPRGRTEIKTQGPPVPFTEWKGEISVGGVSLG